MARTFIQVSELHKHYGSTAILDGATVAIQDDHRIGVIGRNGAGKSTLCRIILGEEQADGGRISMHADMRLSYLEQKDPFRDGESVVDFLIRFEKVDWAVCGGVYKDQLILSVRAAKEEARAGEILRQVVGRLGKAGGHDRRAGGSIRLSSTAPSAIEELQTTLRKRLLKAMKIEDVRGQRLVPLREMLQNLQS